MRHLRILPALLLLIFLSVQPDFSLFAAPAAPQTYSEHLSQMLDSIDHIPHRTHEEALQTTAEWTILIYMAADNDLELQGIGDIDELEAVASRGDVNVIVQMDRADGYDTSDNDWTEARRYFIESNRRRREIGSTLVESLGEINTGDPQTLSDFITWGVNTYASNRYALVIWDHGGSWFGVANDNSHGGDGLTLNELDQALSTGLAATSIEQFDLLAFDACMMGALEVYDTIAPYARYGVASPELIPDEGYDYASVLGDLIANPTMDAETLGRSIVDRFYTYYTEFSTRHRFFSLGLADLSKTATVAKSVADFTSNATSSSALKSTLSAARSQAFVYGGHDDPRYSDYWSATDLLNMMTGITSTAVDDPVLPGAAQTVIDAVGGFLIYDRASTAMASTTGLSIYFPRTKDFFTQDDRSTKYANQTPDELQAWQSFLTDFYNNFTEAVVAPVIKTATTRPDRTTDSTDDASISTFTPTPAPTATATPSPAPTATVTPPTADTPTRTASTAVFEIESNAENISTSALVISVPTRDERSTIIYYERFDGSQISMNWDGTAPILRSGERRVPVMVMTNRFDPTRATVNGTYQPANGSKTEAQLVFDRVTGRVIAVWSVRDTDLGRIPSEVTPLPGDTFTPFWTTLDESHTLVDRSSMIVLPIGTENPLRLERLDLAAGAYSVQAFVEDFGGNSADVDFNVSVTETGDFLTDLDGNFIVDSSFTLNEGQLTLETSYLEGFLRTYGVDRDEICEQVDAVFFDENGDVICDEFGNFTDGDPFAEFGLGFDDDGQFICLDTDDVFCDEAGYFWDDWDEVAFDDPFVFDDDLDAWFTDYTEEDFDAWFDEDFLDQAAFEDEFGDYWDDYDDAFVEWGADGIYDDWEDDWFGSENFEDFYFDDAFYGEDFFDDDLNFDDYFDEDYFEGAFSFEDNGGEDYGVDDCVFDDSCDYGGEDYGGEDYGGEDYGSNDYGGEDYGSEDYGGDDYGGDGDDGY